MRVSNDLNTLKILTNESGFIQLNESLQTCACVYQYRIKTKKECFYGDAIQFLYNSAKKVYMAYFPICKSYLSHLAVSSKKIWDASI